MKSKRCSFTCPLDKKGIEEAEVRAITLLANALVIAQHNHGPDNPLIKVVKRAKSVHIAHEAKLYEKAVAET